MGPRFNKILISMLLSMLFSTQGLSLELLLDDSDSLSIPPSLPTLLTARDSGYQDPKHFLTQDYSPDLYNQAIQPGPDTSWHKIELVGQFSAQSAQQKVLVVNTHILRNLSFYLFEGERLIQSRHLGLDNGQQREWPYHSPHFPFQIQDGQRLTLLVMMQTDGPGLMPMEIYSQAYYQKITRMQDIFWGAVIAVLLATALYNVFVYAMNPNLAYLWYLAFHSTAFVYFSALNGFGYWLWPLKFQLALAQNIMSMNFLLIFIIVNFANVFLEAKKYAPTHYKYIHFFSTSGLVGFVACFFIAEYNTVPVFAALQFIGSVFGLSMGYRALMNKFYPARYFLLSWSFTIFGGAIGMMTFMDILPANFFNMHGFLFGTMAELFLLSIALASRIKYIEKKLLSQSYKQPDSSIANYSYLKQILPDRLPEMLQRHEKLALLVANTKGFREMLSLYGPAIISKTYQYYTDHLSLFLAKQDWGVALPLPTGDKVYIIGLPGSQVLILLSVDSDDSNKSLEHIIDSLIKESNRIVRFSAIKMTIELEVGYAFLSDPTEFHKCYLQAQTALLSNERQSSQYQLYNPGQDTLIKEQLALMHELESAIIYETLRIHIQPQFNLKDNALNGGEVLLRWQHAQKGNIPPVQFILLAERSGLIYPITQLVFKQTCLWLQRLAHQDSELKHFNVSINLSALDMAQDNLLPFFQDTLHEYQVNAHQITLEVTESAVMDNPKKFLATIKKLKGAGFKISIDDFGTGYSSMQYLQTMQADEIKIDMAFIHDIHLNETNQNIVKAIIQLAHSTHAHTVAEGVQYSEEADYLNSLDCQVAQGFYWNPALPLKEFEEKYLSIKPDY